MRLLALTAALLLSVPFAGAATFFSDGFESGLGGWTEQFMDAGCSVSADPSAANSGGNGFLAVDNSTWQAKYFASATLAG